MNPYRFIIARLNGIDIERDFDHYLRLVRKGIAGFIIFGGELETVRQGIKELQREATEPLIIASDLEQGLGGQIKGGTLFPPAMAIASAIKTPSYPSPFAGEGEGGRIRVRSLELKLLRSAFKAIAIEAKYAGINTIFAPVLDINTNPENPIISTRAFGEDPETVSFFGCEMIKILQAHGIAACGKHFPGHGDTEVDSHISLPAVKKDLPSLEKSELVPFKKAIDAGVKMMMLGHLSIPAIDPSGIPASLSEKTVTFLREKMSFRGITITDALNMGAIGKYAEEEASLMALRAGVDILLHPTDPDKIASYLEFIEFKGHGSGVMGHGAKKRVQGVTRRCNFEEHRNLSEELTRKAIKIKGSIKQIRRPFLIILNDDRDETFMPLRETKEHENRKPRTTLVLGKFLINTLRARFSNIKQISLASGEDILWDSIPKGRDIIVAVFSGVKAWKGGAGPWLYERILELRDRATTFVSFGSPYVLNNIDDANCIYAYWGSDIAQKAVAEQLCKCHPQNSLPNFSK